MEETSSSHEFGGPHTTELTLFSNDLKVGRPQSSPAHPRDHDTTMTTATTTNFYMQHSQNGTIHGKSPLSKPAYGDSESDDSDDVNEFVAAGRRDPEVYERTLQSWRAAIRRPIVSLVEKESHIIAAMQVL